MTKAELVSEIALRTGIEKALVMQTVESCMEVIKDTMGRGDNVYLRGFGTFEIKHRAPKTARNIAKNTTIQIPARKVPAFKPSKVFTAIVDKKNNKR